LAGRENAFAEKPAFATHERPAWATRADIEDDATVASDSAANGVRYLLSDHQVRLSGSVEEDYWRWSKQIVNESGLMTASQVRIDFGPTYQKVSIHSVTVRREGRAIDRLDLGSARIVQREPNLEAQVYDGRQSIVMFVPDLRVGDVLDYDFTIRGSDATLDGMYANRFVLGFPEAVGRLRVRLLAPRSRLFSFAADGPIGGLDVKPSIATQGDVTEYLWDRRQVPPSVPSFKFAVHPEENVFCSRGWRRQRRWRCRTRTEWSCNAGFDRARRVRAMRSGRGLSFCPPRV
jgi:hypothetical protein